MSAETKQETYDLESVYDAEIAPLMEQIIAICKRERMPMFASFTYADDPTGDWSKCTTHLPFKGRRVARYEECVRLVYERPRESFMAMTIVGGPKGNDDA